MNNSTTNESTLEDSLIEHINSTGIVSNCNINYTSYSNGTIFTSSNYGNIDYTSYSNFELDGDNLAIDIEKLFKYPENKKDMLKEIINNFVNESDHNIKRMLFNTLNSYSLFIDKKMLERKVKISNTLSDIEQEDLEE